jgi:hypothetical protein
MDPRKDHISVCICTYKRQKLLSNLLDLLEKQVTDGLFDYLIVIVTTIETNPQKAWSTLLGNIESISGHRARTEYRNGQKQGRRQGRGKFLAFMDDDEFPDNRWLSPVPGLQEMERRRVLAPVFPASRRPGVVLGGFSRGRPTKRVPC